jgi:hypothetical protein
MLPCSIKETKSVSYLRDSDRYFTQQDILYKNAAHEKGTFILTFQVDRSMVRSYHQVIYQTHLHIQEVAVDSVEEGSTPNYKQEWKILV